jgi:N-acetylglutamate synthase-like GNAT family acetyltransferase
MEEADFKVLNNPAKNILNKGGHIFVALYKGEPVGVCALIRMDKQTYELAKMAVSPVAQGRGIGVLLGQAIIKKAKKLGASTLYLESNTILESAINLYYKLGFKKVTGHSTPYQRCNIQMELSLK